MDQALIQRKYNPRLSMEAAGNPYPRRHGQAENKKRIRMMNTSPCRKIPLMLLISLLALLLPVVEVAAQVILNPGRALEIAMENSPAIKRAGLNLERSQASLSAQKAALKSNFSLSLTPLNYRQYQVFDDLFSTWYTTETKESYGTFRVVQPIKWTDGTLSLVNRFSWKDAYSGYQNQTSKTYSNDIYISLEQPIFTYNRRALELRELELNLERTALSYAIQRLDVEWRVMQGFFDVYKRKMNVGIAAEELENRRQSYRIMKNKVEAGIAKREELYQAELDMAKSKSTSQNQEVALENALDEFKLLLGLSVYESVDITYDVTHRPIEIDLEKAIAHGLEYRMELSQRSIDIANAELDLERTSALNEFWGSINVAYGSIGTDEKFENIYDAPEKNQQFSLSLEVPLWDWGEKKSRIKASKAVIENNKLQMEDDRNNIIIDIRRAYRDLQNLVIQIEIAEQNVRNAQLTYDINLERYENGDLTSMDLNLFQTQLSQAKTGLVEALIDYRLALLNMKIQSLWDFEANRSVVTTGEEG
jgi:outer membrane protein TolC